MIQPNPTRIANRIGRIVFATILAGMFASLLEQFGGFTWGENTTSPLTPLEWYTDAVADIMIWTILLTFIVPIVMGVYWLLSSRLSWTRKWQILLSGAVLSAVILGGLWNDPTLEIAIDTAVLLVYGLAILAAISIVDVLFAGRPADELTSGHVATGTGILVVVFAICVPLVAIGSAATGVVLPVDDTSPVDKAFDAEGEPYPDYMSLDYEYTDRDDHELADVTVTAGEDPPERNYSYNVTETHIGPEYVDVQAYVVDDGTERTAVEGHYYYELRDADGEPVHYDSIVNSGVEHSVANDEYGHIPSANVPESSTGTIEMEGVDSMWVYFDAVNEDGEVERYMVHLDRSENPDDESLEDFGQA